MNSFCVFLRIWGFVLCFFGGYRDLMFWELGRHYGFRKGAFQAFLFPVWNSSTSLYICCFVELFWWLVIRVRIEGYIRNFRSVWFLLGGGGRVGFGNTG